MHPNQWVSLGAGVAGLAVAAGAFGAHALTDRLEPRQLVQFEVAVRYQMYHALALVLVGLLTQNGWISGQLTGWSFLGGIALFSGCLYGYVFTGSRLLVMIVPMGGMLLLIGWLALVVSAMRTTRQ